LSTLAIGYACYSYGGGGLAELNLSLLILGIAASILAACASAQLQYPQPERVALAAAVLFPAYIAFQLVPLPLTLVRILSPERAEITDALASVMPRLSFTPLAISPTNTWLYLPRMTGYVLVFVLVREVARRSKGQPWWPVVPLILIGGLEAVWGLIQRLAGAQTVSGTYANKDHYAGLLEMTLPLTIMYGIALLYRGRVRGVFSTSSTFKACGVLSLAAVTLLAITFSFSRMGFVSMLGSLFVMGALAVGSKLRGWRRWPALMGLAVLILLVFVFLPPDELVQRFGQIRSDATTEGRWPIWKDTLDLIRAYPLFGCGMGNYYPGLLKYQTSQLGWAWLEAHNDYLQLLSELGVIGFLIPTALMAAVFVRAARAALFGIRGETHLLGVALAGGIAAILIHSVADFNLYIPANAMVLWWLSGISASLPTPGRREPSPPVMKRASCVPKFVGTVGCLLCLYAAAWLIFLHLFDYDWRAEPIFCRFGICDTGTLLSVRELLHGGTTAAVLPPGELLEFLRRDPAGPYRWCDLGESVQKAGEVGTARYCFNRAIALGPNLPYMLLRAAKFHVGLGEKRDAVDLMARTLKADPEFDWTIFGAYQQMQITVDEILRHGLPTGPRASRSFIRLLIDQERIPDVAKTWDWIVARSYADDKLANEYVEFLMRNKKPEAAAQAWAQYAGSRSKGYPESNRLFNGDFESDPAGSRFDWSLDPASGAAIDFDRDAPHSGARALRIRFDGTKNVTDTGVRQTVFLKPGRYRFQAYVRSKEISTDEGVSFSVADPEAPKRLSFTTEAMLGTNDWKLVEHAFQALPGTGLVEVRLVRKKSWRFDNLIRGTVWLDQVSISEEKGEGAARPAVK